MTPEQALIVKADILANPDLNSQPMSGDGAYAIAAMYNAEAVPAYVVWKTNVSAEEIMRNGMDWARVDNLTVGKARIWDWLTRLGTFNAAKTNVRAGIDAAWVGTAADLAVRANIYTHCKRNATRLEKLLATGAGTPASPSTMGLEGAVPYNEIEALRGV